jgi:hypothetical protein
MPRHLAALVSMKTLLSLRFRTEGTVLPIDLVSLDAIDYSDLLLDE